MRVLDEEGGSDGSQSAVGGIEERVGGLVVLRSDPFALEHAPERLRDVELRRVRREIETIVGKNTPYQYVEKWSVVEGVAMKGYVEDIYKEYEQCRVVVTSIYHGAGTAIKALEAMQVCCPVVSSPYGVRGHDDIFVSGEDYLLAKDANSFAQHVIAVMKSEELNHKLLITIIRCISAKFQ